MTATAVSGSRVDLAWADNSTDEDGFKIYRSTDGVNWSWFASANPNVNGQVDTAACAPDGRASSETVPRRGVGRGGAARST